MEQRKPEMHRLKTHYGRGRKLNQRSRAQLRENSGVATATDWETVVEETMLAGASGNVQITADKMRVGI